MGDRLMVTGFRPSRHASRPVQVSFEFFPPKTPEMETALWSAIGRLAPLGPNFVSVTYGAGGSTRERTHNTVARLVQETDLKPAAHLTCVAATREEIDEVVRAYWDAGVRHIVALRGDPLGGLGTPYEAHPGGYAQTSDLVAGIKRIGNFEVSVSAYPEKHPEAASLDADLDALQAKVDAGADRAITQFFFDNDLYLRFMDKVLARGIKIPVDQDVETRKLIAAAVAAEQVLDLVDRGVKDIHFYTMNRADLVYAVCHLLGLRAGSKAEPERAAA
jgi:methylenetetrahydrofolate reductase (NADPH)